MNYRFMRVVVFFDLPVLTAFERRSYSQFRKCLLKAGFMMVQESVYCKMAINTSAADAIIENIRKNSPPDGLVQVLKITEKQYNKMEFIVGEKSSEILDTDERLVVL